MNQPNMREYKTEKEIIHHLCEQLKLANEENAKQKIEQELYIESLRKTYMEQITKLEKTLEWYKSVK